MAPHAIMHDFHDSIAGHLAHHAGSMQQSVAPVASAFSPSENMRIVVPHAAKEIHLGLQGALAMLGSAFVDMANIHAPVFIVKGHGGLRLGIGGSHSGGVPIFTVLRLHRCSNRGITLIDFKCFLKSIQFFFFVLIFGMTFCCKNKPYVFRFLWRQFLTPPLPLFPVDKL